jgi:hypothetical protein
MALLLLLLLLYNIQKYEGNNAVYFQIPNVNITFLKHFISWLKIQKVRHGTDTYASHKSTECPFYRVPEGGSFIA